MLGNVDMPMGRPIAPLTVWPRGLDGDAGYAYPAAGVDADGMPGCCAWVCDSV